MKGFVLTLVLALAGVVLVGAEEKAHRAMLEDGVQKVELVGGGYYFRPDHIVVKVNRPVELKVRKEPGMVPHNLVLNAPEAGIDFKTALRSEPHLIQFTPTKTGRFPFYCDKKMIMMDSHREKGMEGVLEVVE